MNFQKLFNDYNFYSPDWSLLHSIDQAALSILGSIFNSNTGELDRKGNKKLRRRTKEAEEQKEKEGQKEKESLEIE